MKLNTNTVHKVILFAALLLCSCRGRDRQFTRMQYYTGGHVKSEVGYLDDTIKNGIANYYFGQDHNFSIYMEEFFKNGVLDSTFKEYYPNGLVKEQGMHRYGVPMGAFYFNYPDGKIKCFDAVGYNDRTFYAIFYDSLGNKTSEKGLNISPVIANLNQKNSYTTTDTIHMAWCIAEPPGYKNETQLTLLKKDDAKNEYTPLQPAEPGKPICSIIDYRKTFSQPGSYELMLVSKLSDTVTKNVRMDTSIAEVVVR